MGLLDIKSTNGSITFTVTDYQTDGIQMISQGTQVANGSCYNLHGQRVANDYKGLVIVGGKKVLKK